MTRKIDTDPTNMSDGRPAREMQKANERERDDDYDQRPPTYPGNESRRMPLPE